MNAASDPPGVSVDDLLRRLRTSVYEQDETTLSTAEQLRHQLELHTVRAGLLSHMGTTPIPAVTAEFVRLATALQEWVTRDSDVALDVATALLTASVETPLLEHALGVLHDSFSSDDLDTLPALRFLLNSGYGAQAARLLRALVPAANVGVPSRAAGADASPAPPQAATRPGPAVSLLSSVVVLCQQALGRNPRDDGTRRVLASSLIELGRPEEALPIVETLLVDHPGDEEVTWYHVAILDGLRRPRQALAALDTLPRAALDDPAVISYRLRLMVDAGMTSEALQLAETALHNHPDDESLTLAYIEALDRTEGNDKALAVAREALARHPDSPSLSTVTGGLLVDAERFSEAISLLENTVSSGDAGGDAARLLASALLATDRAAEALQCVDMALSAHPQDAMLLVQRAMTLQSLGRFVEALDAVDAAERAGTRQPTLWELRGDLLLALGRGSEAVPQYARVLAEGSDDFRHNLVQKLEDSALDVARDQPEDALNLLVAVMDAGTLSPNGHAVYAELLRLNGQLKRAVSEADAARGVGADPAWTAGTTSQALTLLGRSKEALEELDETEDGSEDAFRMSVRIDALVALEQTSVAAELLDRHFPASDRPDPDEEPDEWLTWSVGTRAFMLLNRDEFEDARALIRRYTRTYGRTSDWDYLTAISYSRQMQHDRALPLLARVVEDWGDKAGVAWDELVRQPPFVIMAGVRG